MSYEALFDQYEKSSGEKYRSDLKTATLLRCAPQKTREFLQLTLRDVVTYLDMKEALLSHERTAKGNSQESTLKQLSTSVVEILDMMEVGLLMEVDRVFDKGGKGKQKGKGKKGGDGKGKGWWNNMWQFGGRGHGRGKGRGGSKDKGRGKGKSKGKKGGGKSNGKGKRKNSDRKGAKKRDPCFVCGSYDHWSRECPKEVNNVNHVFYDWNGNEGNADTILQTQQSHQLQSQSVRHVHQGQSSSSSTQAPITSNSSTSCRSSAGGSTVRRIFNWGLESNPFSAVRMVVDDEPKSNSAEGVDFFYEWFEGKYDIDLNLCVIDEDISRSPVSEPMSIDDECSHVRATLAGLPEPRVKNLASVLTQDQMFHCCQCHL